MKFCIDLKNSFSEKIFSKKQLNFIFVFLCLLVFSCAEKPPEEILKPDVKDGDGNIVVSIAKMEGAKYLNIFRAEYNDTIESSEPDFEKRLSTIYNIAQVTPKNDVLTSYVFIDNYFVKGQNYCYRMRYWDGISYKVTSWSDPISSNSNDIKFLTNDNLRYSIPDGAYFLFDSELKQLQIKFDGIEKEITDIPNFDSYIDGKGFRPALAFSYGEGNDEVVKIFTSQIKIELTESAKPIDLRSLLTDDFFDKDIKLKYIVSQKNNENNKYTPSGSSDEKEIYYTEYLWSLPNQIPLKDIEGKEIETIKIPKNTAEEGGDYSNIGIEGGNSATVSPSVNILPDYSSALISF